MESSSVTETKQNNLKCSECNKTFKHKNSIYNHRKTCQKNNLCVEIKKTNDEIKELKKKYKTTKVKCDICDKSISQGNLSTHKKTHENIEISSATSLGFPNVTQEGCKKYSLEETYNFLMWMNESQQFFINSLEEFKDAFNTFKKINTILKDNKIVISLDFNNYIKDVTEEPSINDNDIQEPSINDNDDQGENIIISIDINNDNDDGDLRLNDNDLRLNDNNVQEENIIISICENNDDYEEILKNQNIFEEDIELEDYYDPTFEHSYSKVIKFLERYKECNLINHDIPNLNKCIKSITKMKESLSLLMRLTDDDICDNSISKVTREIINNNFLTRTLFTAIKLKYQEIEDEDDEWDKNVIIKQIFDDLNKTRDKIPIILEKKWKLFEKIERKNNK